MATAILAAGSAGCTSASGPAEVQAADVTRGTTLCFADGTLEVNGLPIPFPAEPEQLFAVLGQPTRSIVKSNTIHVWDHVGLYAYEDPRSHMIRDIDIDYADGSYDFSPHSVFTGQVSVLGLTVTADTTEEELREAGFVRGFPLFEEVCLSVRPGRSNVLARVKGTVTHLSLGWTGHALGEGMPAATPGMPLFRAAARDYGFPFDDVVTEVERHDNVSTITIDIFGVPSQGSVGRAMFDAGAAGELAARLGFLYFLMLGDGPEIAGTPPKAIRSTRIIGFTNSPDPDVAVEFPDHFDPAMEYVAVPVDVVRLALGDWRKVDAKDGEGK